MVRSGRPKPAGGVASGTSRSSRCQASEPSSSEDLDPYPGTDAPAGPTPSYGKSPKSAAPDNAEPAVVEVSGLRKTYGAVEAVRGVDLRVARGEIFALLGTNGAGKTTTLEILEGYQRQSSGRVGILGLDPWRDRVEVRARTGIMVQEAGFAEELTPVETLQLWSGISSRSDDPDALLHRFDLHHRRDVKVASLSGGERRRLDLCLAVWGSPELLVLDEPTTGLDPESRRRVWQAVRELNDRGCTVVLTTHYLEEAEALADRLAIMHEGRVVLAGTLAQILATRPARIHAWLPPQAVAGVSDLPGFDGSVTLDSAPDGWRLTAETPALQSDLTTLLNWAASRSIELGELRASTATLEDIYHRVHQLAPDEPGAGPDPGGIA